MDIPQVQSLRYGENPHQKAALYGSFFDCFVQLQGKELSFNNIIDITAATYLIGEFQKPTVAILKHTNPCGVASAETLLDAHGRRLLSPISKRLLAVSTVVNQTMDADLAEIISNIFCEVIIAPAFTKAAREVFGKKKNLRLMTVKASLPADSLREVRSVVGGVLMQDRDTMPDRPAIGRLSLSVSHHPKKCAL